VFFFWFQFCDIAQVKIVHKNILAKFGNVQNIKVNNLKHPLMLQAVMANFSKKNSRSRGFLMKFFFSQNIFCKMKKKSRKKKTH
jgi:hypothetical protein